MSAVEITLPKWGMTMQEAVVSEWLVAVGDTVTEGQPVVRERQLGRVADERPDLVPARQSLFDERPAGPARRAENGQPHQAAPDFRCGFGCKS